MSVFSKDQILWEKNQSLFNSTLEKYTVLLLKTLELGKFNTQWILSCLYNDITWNALILLKNSVFSLEHGQNRTLSATADQILLKNVDLSCFSLHILGFLSGFVPKWLKLTYLPYKSEETVNICNSWFLAVLFVKNF